MNRKLAKTASWALAPLFLVAAAGCDTAEQKEAQIQRHMEQSQKFCPAREGLDASRPRMVLAEADNSKVLKRLADDNVTVCLDRGMTDVKPVPPYNYPVFAVYYPPENEKGALLMLWDDGNPPKEIRPLMNEDSVIRHPASAFRGVIGILNRDKAWLKPDQLNIAIGDAGCGYSCTGITWYNTEKQQELLKLNPQLANRPR